MNGHLSRASTVTRANPLEWWYPTAPQEQFLRWRPRFGVWRGGNRLGKTTAHAAHIIHLARNTHPYRPPWTCPPEMLLIGYSWEQMDGLLRKVWEFIPPGEAHPKLRYEKGGGIKGFKEPRIELVDGPGQGTLIHLATYKQGTQRIAGMSVDYAGCDEPPPPGMMGELMGRVEDRRGDVRVTMTPTPEAPPQVELRELVERQVFEELQTSLSPAAFRPLGRYAPPPWKTSAEVAEMIARWAPAERAMRAHGAWEALLEGRQIDGFEPHHLRADAIEDGVSVELALAMDHGIRPGRQYAVLLAYTRRLIWALDEYRPTRTTSYQEDGRALVDLLADHGFHPRDVRYWVGDRAADSIKKAVRKSNKLLAGAIAEACGVQREDLGLWIRTPEKGVGSVYEGCWQLNSLFREDRLAVHPRCKVLVEALNRWEGDPRDPQKDPVDGLRYGVDELLGGGAVAQLQMLRVA